MSATATWILLAFMGAAPLPGSYEVLQDQFRAEKKEWGLFCGKLPKVKTSPKGTRVQLSVNGDKWVFSGGNRYFGTRICEGTLPNLGVTQKKSLGENGAELRCATRRVTRGTEQTTQTIQHGADGKVTVVIRGSVESRKDGDLCLSTFVWKTVLAPKNLARAETALAASDSESQMSSQPVARSKRGKKRKSAKKRSCKKPGRPVELELEPNPLIATTPERRVCVKAVARDKNGCRVKLRKKRLKYKVYPKGAGRINRRGCFRLSATHQEDSEISIVARYRKKLKARARVLTSEPRSEPLDIRLPEPSPAVASAEIQVEPEPRNDENVEMVPKSAASSAGLPSSSAAPEMPLDVAGTDEAASAEAPPGEFPTGMLVVLAILFVGGGGALGLRQRRNAALADVLEQIEAMDSAPAPEPVDLGSAFDFDSAMMPAGAAVPAPVESGIRYCAKCGSEFASGGTETCPIDGEVLQWRERRVPDSVPSVPPSGGMVCPTCFTRYDASVTQCYRDGTQLVPDYGQFND